MVATIRDVTNLAQDSSTQTVRAHTVAAAGQTKVVRTLTPFRTSHLKSNRPLMLSQLEILAQIDDIVATIRGISEQTNPLA